jgi:hypothetical protein
MTRVLYRWLLWLHPPAFRREFADEMLCIFEEAAAGGAAPLFADGLISLVRQWLLRSRSWKLAAAVIGGLLEITAGVLGMLAFSHGRMTAHLAAVLPKPPSTPAEALAIGSFIPIAMWAVTGVLLMVVTLVCWVSRLNGRRLHRRSVGPRELRAARAAGPGGYATPLYGVAAWPRR